MKLPPLGCLSAPFRKALASLGIISGRRVRRTAKIRQDVAISGIRTGIVFATAIEERLLKLGDEVDTSAGGTNTSIE